MEERKYIVYMHTNKINNKVYVGITNRDINTRWGKDGSRYLKKKPEGDYYQPTFARAIKKYGWNSFEHIIFADNLLEKDAKRIEKLLIALYKTNCCRYKNPSYGYNMTDGGDGMSGNKPSEETRAKRSKSLMGHTISEETKEKIRRGNTGKRLSEEHKRKIKDAICGEKHPWYGRHHSEETKEKLAMAHRGKKLSEEHKQKIKESMMDETKQQMILNQPNRKQVVCVELGLAFISLSDASRQLDICLSSIRKACSKKQKTAGGYHWEYVDGGIAYEYYSGN